ncbi:MAG: hypothetical protein U5J63_01425 [Fodinibius sp.]|nr:hypothetical protein [Fodinibius sp.]
MLKNAFSSSDKYQEQIGVNPSKDAPYTANGVDFNIPVDSLDNYVRWYYEGRPIGTDRQGNKRYYTQVQDEVILNLLRTNDWLRPVYFANTVSTQSQMNLQPYFRFEGKAFRVVPQRHDSNRFGWLNPNIHAKRLKKFQFREWDNPDAYFDENIRRMLGNYRFSITELAKKYQELGKPDSAAYWLQWGQDKLPFRVNDNNLQSVVLYAYQYADVGDTQSAYDLAKEASDNALNNLEQNMNEFDSIRDRISQIQQEIKNARQNANMNAQQRLRKKIQNIASRRQQVGRQISRSIYHLTVIQRIYFMNGNDAEAKDLADTVNGITDQRLPFPTTEEENKREIQNYPL